MAEVKKAEALVVENRALIVDALDLLLVSKGRALSKVKNPVIVKAMQAEMENIRVAKAAVNSL